MNQVSQNRIFGLDLLRSIAIILVINKHTSVIFHPDINYFSIPDGVDLFFVLSGFLIGSILLKSMLDEEINFKFISQFLKRRWFRTLPNYFLFLLINIILIKFALIKGIINKYLITYFFFFQNFHKPYDFLYWESWSLSVEEWFYFLFPILLWIIYKTMKSKPAMIYLIATTLFILFSLAYRLLNYDQSADWDLYIHKIVLTRFDTIGFGLLMAYFYRFHSEILSKFKIPLFLTGIAILFFVLNIDPENIYFRNTFFYSFIGISIAAMIPFFVSLKEERIPLKPFRFISIISYSMYLVNMPLLQIVTKNMNENNSIFIYISFWILTIIVSYSVYKWFEKPMTDLRERF